MTSQDNQNEITTSQDSLDSQAATIDRITVAQNANEQAASEQIDLAHMDIATITDTANLPQPSLQPIRQATYKANTTDFIVNELLPLDFTGEGEHLWLHIEKSGMNTAYLAKILSEWADIPLRDVGYSGLKDRHALTTQWFSLRQRSNCHLLSLHQWTLAKARLSLSLRSTGTIKNSIAVRTVPISLLLLYVIFSLRALMTKMLMTKVTHHPSNYYLQKRPSSSI